MCKEISYAATSRTSVALIGSGSWTDPSDRQQPTQPLCSREGGV